MDSSPEMTQMLKLLNKDFKAAIITMLNEVKENILKITKKNAAESSRR